MCVREQTRGREIGKERSKKVRPTFPRSEKRPVCLLFYQKARDASDGRKGERENIKQKDVLF